MAAGEDQLQPLVGKGRLLHLVLHGLGHLEQARLLGERAVAAQAVDRAVAGGDRQPGARVGRRAVARPALGRDRERLLRGLLGEVEVAEEADQGGEDAAPLVAEDLLEQRLPLHQRPHLDRAAHPRRRDPRGDLDRRVEVVGLDQEEAAQVLLRVDERAVGEQRLPSCTRTVVAVSTGCSCSPPMTPGDCRRARYSRDDLLLLVARKRVELGPQAPPE